MAYQTGAATSYNDLLQQLAAWLVTRGWTLAASQADGSGWRAHLSKGGWYVHLKTTASGRPWGNSPVSPLSYPCLWAYLSTSFAGVAANWNANLAGAPTNPGQTLANGAGCGLNNGAQTSYHFFDDGADNIVVVVETTPGVFHNFGFGFSVLKHGGSWTGGAYLFGAVGTFWVPDNTAQSRPPFHYGGESTDNTSYVRADVDTFTGKWLACGAYTNDSCGYTGKFAASTVAGVYNPTAYIPHTGSLAGRTTSSVNSQVVLLPIRLYAARDAGGYCLLATVPSVFQANAVGNGYAPGAEIKLGADTYKLFTGWAVKKVA